MMKLNGTINLATWQPAAAPCESDPRAIIDWAAERFRGRPMVMTTSFGMEGVALLDMLATRLPDFRAIYVDTDFLFRETHALRERLEQRYPSVRFEAAKPLLSPEEQAADYGDTLWLRNPDLCCKMRKVEPLYRAIAGVDVWFAALRRDQSATRWTIKVVDWDWQYQLIKVCPIASWSRQQVYEYVRSRGLPYNELHDRGYPSIGCTHCTRPVEGAKPWDYSREGRWAGAGKSECGLHGAGI
jgi:phosphoadenosine phosphosulfate reductase